MYQTKNLWSVYDKKEVISNQALSYLISLGHQEIGFINHPVNHDYSAKERLHGYKLALKDAGIEYDEKKVEYGNWSIESGYEALKRLLDLKLI